MAYVAEALAGAVADAAMKRFNEACSANERLDTERALSKRLAAALHKADTAFWKLANAAGDVPEWNRGGFAYEASLIVDNALEAYKTARKETP
jgi:hypothetical protein